MDCTELFPKHFKDSYKLREVRYQNFNRLHDEAKRLIMDWFRRAENFSKFGRDDTDFEAFIYLWISFNGWASCVTGENRDTYWLESICADKQMNNMFNELLKNDKTFATKINHFYELLPVFSVNDLRKKRLLRYSFSRQKRDKLVDFYLNKGADKFQPACWKRHFENGEEIPKSLAHTLKAIYTIRCNLFHGEKGRHSEIDRAFVSNALGILLPLFRAALNYC
jgi:hypothetical protein